MQLHPLKPRDHLVLLIYPPKASGISPLPTSPSVFAMLQTLITPPLSYSNVLLTPVFLLHPSPSSSEMTHVTFQFAALQRLPITYRLKSIPFKWHPWLFPVLSWPALSPTTSTLRLTA